jgi:hypothetical protein
MRVVLGRDLRSCSDRARGRTASPGSRSRSASSARRRALRARSRSRKETFAASPSGRTNCPVKSTSLAGAVSGVSGVLRLRRGLGGKHVRRSRRALRGSRARTAERRAQGCAASSRARTPPAAHRARHVRAVTNQPAIATSKPAPGRGDEQSEGPARHGPGEDSRWSARR